MDIVDLLNQHNIHPKSYKPGEHHLLCPQCSATRKPHNRKKRCLSLHITDDGRAYWKCHNFPCDFYGPKPGAAADYDAENYKFDSRPRYWYGDSCKVRTGRLRP